MTDVNPRLRVFTDAEGHCLYQSADGEVFDDMEEANTYVEQNEAGMLVNEFMSAVDANPAAYLADKKGKLPSVDRALVAQKTRLRKSAHQVLSWYLTR